MKDGSKNNLKVGDTVMFLDGIEGKIVNRGGKTWVDCKDGSVLFSEVDLATVTRTTKCKTIGN